MDRFLDYELKLKAYFQKREATLRKIKNLEFMLLSSLSRFCIATGTSMEMLFSMQEGRESRKEFDSFTQILSLATIMKTVDALREEKNISKRELCRRMDYDRSNFQKLYKCEKSINLVLLLRMIDALDLFPTEFLFKCSEINKQSPGGQGSTIFFIFCLGSLFSPPSSLLEQTLPLPHENVAFEEMKGRRNYPQKQSSVFMQPSCQKRKTGSRFLLFLPVFFFCVQGKHSASIQS